MDNQRLILAITREGNLEQLIEKNGLTHIVIHKQWFDGCESRDLIAFLSGRPILSVLSEDDSTAVYAVR